MVHIIYKRSCHVAARRCRFPSCVVIHHIAALHGGGEGEPGNARLCAFTRALLQQPNVVPCAVTLLQQTAPRSQKKQSRSRSQRRSPKRKFCGKPRIRRSTNGAPPVCTRYTRTVLSTAVLMSVFPYKMRRSIQKNISQRFSWREEPDLSADNQAKHKIAGRIIPCLVLGFWDKNAGHAPAPCHIAGIFRPQPGS